LLSRIKLNGYLMGLICLIMFPNISVIPDQITRRIAPAYTVITPHDPLVLQFRTQFFTENINISDFAKLSFADQMGVVDEFIKEKIIWKNDFSQYGVIGLLTTPQEVLTRMAGDCQGQAVTTASLLLSMNSLEFGGNNSTAPFGGFNAWVSETPFHWWTHAQNNQTGESRNLNIHGSAGSQGSVLPQPIDMVYTRPQAACQNCSWVDANNNNPFFYIADPITAFMISWTGSHIFLRSNWSLTQVNWKVNIVGLGLALAVLITLYSSYLANDFSCQGVFRRFKISVVLAIGPVMTGLSFWTTIFYPVGLLHLLGYITFCFYFVSIL